MVLLLLALAGLMVLGVLSIAAWKRKADRARTLAALARANGFHYSAEDEWFCTRIPFNAFRLGDKGIVENVLLGQAPDGTHVRVFDFTSWREREVRGGMTVRRGHQTGGGIFAWSGHRPNDRVERSGYRRLTCCLTETDGALPHLVLQPHTLATRVLSKVGMPDIRLESEEFNRRFLVSCEDETFARRCVDARMMEFLLSTEGRFQFELRGRWALIAASEVPAKLCLSLVGLSTAFRQAIPSVVWQYHAPLVAEPER